jgi:glycosyltransferase involved in cell wall biosynthesis
MTTPAKSQRLAIVVSHPTQYYSPWFRWMAAHADALHLRVFYLWNAGVNPTHDPQFGKTFAWDVDLLSGYDHEFVPNTARAPGSDRFSGLRNPELPSRLAAWRPDAVLLFGYNYATHLRLILWARLRGLPLIFRGDSHLLGRDRLSWTKRLPLALLYRQFAAFATVGEANREYFRAFGVPAQKLFAVPHCVNADHFTPTDATRAEAARLRTSHGLDGKRIVLFAGKLVSAKQPVELLEAFIRLAPENTALVFVGEGEQRATLKTLAAAHPETTVRFLPFANQSEMPSRYLMADIFTLPSRGHYETWGLAVNEAMHLGVPCLVSDRVGCQLDLVTDRETGWVFQAEDTRALQTALGHALEDIAADAGAFRARVAIRIAPYTYQTASIGLLAALPAPANTVI